MSSPRFHLAPFLAVALFSTLTAVAFADEADDQFAVAAGHYSAQRWQLAAEEFQRFLAQYPEHARQAKATFFLGEALVQVGKFDEAQRQFAVVRQRDPQGRYARHALFRAGECAFLADKADDARESLTAFQMEHPDDALNAYALRYLGELALRAGDAGAAKTHFGAAIERFADGPTANDCRLGLGQAQLHLKQYQDAQATFDALVKEKRVLTEANYWIGQIHKAQEHWETAASSFEAAIAADATHAAVETLRYQMAECLLRVEKFDAVIETLCGTVEANDVAALPATQAYLVALAQQGLGKHDAALATLNSLPNELSGDVASNVLLAKASSLLALGRDGDAIEPLKRYLTSAAQIESGRKSRVLAQIALSYAKGKDFVQAKAALDQLESLDPQAELTQQTMLQLAQIAGSSSESRWAGELYERLASQRSAPQFAAKALMGLARAAHQAGDQDRASALYARLVEQFPTSVEAVPAAMTRAAILEQLQQYDAALAMYDWVIRKNDKPADLPTALMRAANLHDGLKQELKAIELYQRLTADFADSPLVPAALYGWAWCLRDLNRLEESNGKLEELRRNHPTSEYWADATYRLAQFAAQAKEFDRAAALLTELVDAATLSQARPPTAPDEPSTEGPATATNASRKYLIDILPHALYLRAQVAIAQTRWDNAERDLERLMNGDSRSPISLPAEFLRADVAYRRGEYEQAKVRFATLAGKLGGRNDRWTPMVPLRRAQVLAQQKEWAEARVLAEQIAKDYPNFDQQYEADYLIGRCHAADAKLQEARQAYQKVLRSPNGSKTETAAMAQWMIAETFFFQEQYEAAIREYLRVEVLYAYPHWQAGGLLQAGKCYEQLGQWKEAGDVYARLLKLYPQAEFAAEARQRIESVKGRTASRKTP